jgi:hypothetical protein
VTAVDCPIARTILPRVPALNEAIGRLEPRPSFTFD